MEDEEMIAMLSVEIIEKEDENELLYARVEALEEEIERLTSLTKEYGKTVEAATAMIEQLRADLEETRKRSDACQRPK